MATVPIAHHDHRIIVRGRNDLVMGYLLATNGGTQCPVAEGDAVTHRNILFIVKSVSRGDFFCVRVRKPVNDSEMGLTAKATIMSAVKQVPR